MSFIRGCNELRNAQICLEVLAGVRLIKLYAWEAFYADKITGIRKQELKAVRRLA